MRLHVRGVVVVPEILLTLGHPLRDLSDLTGADLWVPLERLAGDVARFLLGRRAHSHREGRRLIVHELADWLLTAADRAAVDVDLLLHVFGGHADRERAQ